MRRAHEEVFALLFMLVFPLAVGFVVAVSIWVDGIGLKFLTILSTWIAATCLLWAIPRLLPRLRGGKVVLRDERGILILANSALTAHIFTWLFFICACVLAFWVVGADGLVSVNALPLTFVGGMVVFQVVLTVSSFIQDKTRTWPVGH